MFDPFNDFASAGYLRNRYLEKDARIVKEIEHEIFTDTENKSTPPLTILLVRAPGGAVCWTKPAPGQ